MTTEMASVAQITTKALAILSKELGPVNTARFINQFSVGSVVSRQSSAATENCKLSTDDSAPPANSASGGTAN